MASSKTVTLIRIDTQYGREELRYEMTHEKAKALFCGQYGFDRFVIGAKRNGIRIESYDTIVEWDRRDDSSSNSSSSNSSSSSSSGGGGCLALVGLVFLVVVGGITGGSDEKTTPVETPQPPAIERVEVVTPPAPAPRAEASASGPCVTANFEPC